MLHVDNLSVKWSTKQIPFTNPNSSNIVVPKRVITICEIFSGEDHIATTSGTATNHIMDQYDKDTGRKKSLRNALHKDGVTVFDKNQRKSIWESYANMTATPRWVTK